MRFILLTIICMVSLNICCQLCPESLRDSGLSFFCPPRLAFAHRRETGYNFRMFSFLSRKGRAESIIVFDVNAESVGAAVVLVEKGALPRVIYTCREYFFHGKTARYDARRLIDSMRATLSRTKDFLAKNILSHPIFRSHPPRKTHYAFSAPWVESAMKTITLAWKEPTAVTAKIITALIEKESKAFAAELSTKPGAPFSIIEVSITSIRLNGYEVREPYGKKAKNIDVSLCMSALPAEIRDAVSSATPNKAIPWENTYASFSSAAAKVVRDIGTEKDFVVLDILGPMTEAAIVRRGALSARITMPLGENMLLDAVAKQFSVSRGEAASHVSMFFAGHADGKTGTILSKIVAEAKLEWKKSFEDAVNALAAKISVPPSLFIIVRSDDAPFFMRTLAGESVMEFGVDRVPFRQTLVAPGFLKSALAVDKNASNDSALLLLSAYFASSSGLPGKK
jgi:hypothetical protein